MKFGVKYEVTSLIVYLLFVIPVVVLGETTGFVWAIFIFNFIWIIFYSVISVLVFNKHDKRIEQIQKGEQK